MVVIAVIQPRDLAFDGAMDHYGKVLMSRSWPVGDDGALDLLNQEIWAKLREHVAFVDAGEQMEVMETICEQLMRTPYPDRNPESDFDLKTHRTYSTPARSIELVHVTPLWEDEPGVAHQPTEINQLGCLARIDHQIVEGVCMIMTSCHDPEQADYALAIDTEWSDLVHIYRSRFVRSGVALSTAGSLEVFYYQDPLVSVNVRFGTDQWSVLRCTNHLYQLACYYRTSSDASINKTATRIISGEKIRGDVLLVVELGQGEHGRAYDNLIPVEVDRLSRISKCSMQEPIALEDQFLNLIKRESCDRMTLAHYHDWLISQAGGITCQECGKVPERKKTCPQCYRAIYCDASCAQKHTKAHREECHQLPSIN